MIILCILGFLYFLPTVLAHNRGHEVAGVLLLNLFFGWTGLGWIALLLWALLSWAPYEVYCAPVVCYRVPVVYSPSPAYYHASRYYYPPSYWTL